MKTLIKTFVCAGLLSLSPMAVSKALAEGEVGTQAFSWTGFSDLASSPTTYSLSQYSGKVVLLVVFQYNCGGCVGNAAKIGRLADTLDRGPDSAKFQAVGTEISTATYANIQTYRNTLTNSGTLSLNFPLVKVPRDTAIAATDGTGEKWKRYNSYRDTYFVIGHDGQIKARVAGNRANAMSAVKYDSLSTALKSALAAAPASLGSSATQASGFRTERAGRGYRFRMNDGFTGTITLRLSDLQGRTVRTLMLTPASPEVVWNAQGPTGNALPYGMYFVQATGQSFSTSLRISVLP